MLAVEFHERKRDVRALPGDVRGDLVVAVVRHLGQKKRVPGKHSIERLVCGGDFTADGDVIVLDHAFHGNTAVPVMLHAVGNNGIRNLVTDFVRVPGRHLLTGEKHLYRPFA